MGGEKGIQVNTRPFVFLRLRDNKPDTDIPITFANNRPESAALGVKHVRRISAALGQNGIKENHGTVFPNLGGNILQQRIPVAAQESR